MAENGHVPGKGSRQKGEKRPLVREENLDLGLNVMVEYSGLFSGS